MKTTSNQISKIDWKFLSFYNIVGKLFVLIPILLMIFFVPIISFFEADGINSDFFLYMVVGDIICIIISIYTNALRKTLENERLDHYGKDLNNIESEEIIKKIIKVLKSKRIKFVKKLNVNIKMSFINYLALFNIPDKEVNIKIEKIENGTFISIGKINSSNKTLIEELIKNINKELRQD